MVNTENEIRPIMRSSTPNATGEPMTSGKLFEIAGESHMAANTPRRAIAISTPMARAISLPLNHLAMALETVVPAISQPQPNIMKPRVAILALPGNDTHQLLSQPQNAVSWNQVLTPTYLIAAPMTMSEADRMPVNRTPILSRMIPANIRKKQNTLRKYSPPAYVPNVPLSQ